MPVLLDYLIIISCTSIAEVKVYIFILLDHYCQVIVKRYNFTLLQHEREHIKVMSYKGYDFRWSAGFTPSYALKSNLS